jgi:hypothetical protein
MLAPTPVPGEAAAANGGVGPADDAPIDAPPGTGLVSAEGLKRPEAANATAAMNTTTAVSLARVRTRPTCVAMTMAA